jgi:adenosine deaminase
LLLCFPAKLAASISQLGLYAAFAAAIHAANILSIGLKMELFRSFTRWTRAATTSAAAPCRSLSRTLASPFALILLFSSAAQAQAPKPKPVPAASSLSQDRVDRGLQVARTSPIALYAWLFKMPKGADLHIHITGAVYAETFISEAIEDHLCVNTTALAFSKPQSLSSTTPPEPVCAEGEVPASQALKDQALYDALVDAFSMRGFVPASGITAHDHFFDAFDKFKEVRRAHLGDWLDELATRAASQNEQYLELMHTPPFPHASAAAAAVPWQDDLAALRDQLLAHGLKEDIAAITSLTDAAEKLRNTRERCGQPDAAPACRVQIRYLFQVLRGLPKEIVFAQTILAMETAVVDPRFVGLNFVMPEDGVTSMRDYDLQMHMLEVLHTLYPNVHIALHAGELAPGLVPYEGLTDHIRGAVEQGHAERIGHGVDIMYETRPHELLKEMAAKHVMVEINLTSNDIILGVAGDEHPFPIYHQFHVPVALSTDDEGVSRINLTNEYVRAVLSYDLHYADLKELVRTGLEHTFLPGESLWRDPDDFRATNHACSHDTVGNTNPSKSCADFLATSEKSRQQWDLEQRFRQFESDF